MIGNFKKITVAALWSTYWGEELRVEAGRISRRLLQQVR